MGEPAEAWEATVEGVSDGAGVARVTCSVHLSGSGEGVGVVYA